MKFPAPHLIAWELTKRCKMGCLYCRASASSDAYPDELSTEKCKSIIDEISSFGQSILIISGGDPLLREDIFEIADYATFKALKVVMAVNPDTLNPGNLEKIKKSGVKRISISIDAAKQTLHDRLRGVPGAFSQAMRATELTKKMEFEFQINTTVTSYNLPDVPQILNLAAKMGAKSFHLFFLVPTGRGENLKDGEISPSEYEQILTFLVKNKDKFSLKVKATCAPHYYRILHQEGKLSEKKGDKRATGCLGGISFCFISNVGKVQPCGYLQVKAGDLKKQSFTQIWEKSLVFNQLRHREKLKGKCKICMHRKICGGCRARAYAIYGDYMEEEPYCLYQPEKL
ncbi:radical SAM protein [Candidatus Aerophobetes bacterium]|nr:radical SAM protein [Candidatus Aerophobetes bacterium]